MDEVDRVVGATTTAAGVEEVDGVGTTTTLEVGAGAGS